MKLNKEIIEFMDTIKRKDIFTGIDYISPLVKRYGMSIELAERIRHEYVCHVFKKANAYVSWDNME